MGQRAVCITCEEPHGPEAYHQLADHCRKRISGAREVIPAYESLVIQFVNLVDDARLGEHLMAFQFNPDWANQSNQRHEIAVDFDAGLDWEVAESISGLSRSEFIAAFCQQDYPVAMFGFVPGFVYLDQLAEALHLPRRDSPRRRIESGSVAIGGGQCGIYRLASPGGWQVIGRAQLETGPAQFVDQFAFGDLVRFRPRTS